MCKSVLPYNIGEAIHKRYFAVPDIFKNKEPGLGIGWFKRLKGCYKSACMGFALSKLQASCGDKAT